MTNEDQRTRRPEDQRTSLQVMKTREPEDLRTNSRIPEEQNIGKPERTWTRVMKSRDQRTGKKKNRGHEYQKIKWPEGKDCGLKTRGQEYQNTRRPEYQKMRTGWWFTDEDQKIRRPGYHRTRTWVKKNRGPTRPETRTAGTKRKGTEGRGDGFGQWADRNPYIHYVIWPGPLAKSFKQIDHILRITIRSLTRELIPNKYICKSFRDIQGKLYIRK